MNTKSVPTIIMLCAGLVACIVMILTGVSNAEFVKILLFVLIAFFIIGCIVKYILDKFIKDVGPEEFINKELSNHSEDDSLDGMSEEEEQKNDDSEVLK